MDGLRVVCLISGGKDSLFSILHCLANGHRVVALGNLHPPHTETEGVSDDLDSYMYQTIGHAVIPLYEKVLGLPLYRQEILGSAVNRDKCYSAGGGEPLSLADETEALIPLLQEIKSHHPDMNAVSTGAILSDYQRTRVESVAIRLGLTPLSYLWQWPNLAPNSQTSLLEDMAAVGQDSRIIKVASGGLDDGFLWQNVADPRTINRLVRVSQRFGTLEGGAVLGEGGEYETLAIAGPPPLWKGRITVDEAGMKTVIGEAGSASTKISNAMVANNTITAITTDVRIPPLLEPSFQAMFEKLQREGDTSYVEQSADENEQVVVGGEETNSVPHSGTHSEPADHLLFADLTGEGDDAASQMRSIMENLAAQVHSAGHSLDEIAYVSIVLRDMADFPAVNAVYGPYFSHPNPPSRVTIACKKVLTAKSYLSLSASSVKTWHDGMRKGLHVQSRSYWAPANIGPYSQAISVPTSAKVGAQRGGLVYIAGQIPLVPASMKLAISPSGKLIDNFAMETVAALQHVARIGRAMHVRQWVGASAFIVASSDDDACRKRDLAREAWRALHQLNLRPRPNEASSSEADTDSFDVWDVTHGSAKGPLHRRFPSSQTQTDEDDWEFSLIPTLHVVRVDALPRESSIEWVTYGVDEAGCPLPEVPHFQYLLDLFSDRILD